MAESKYMFSILIFVKQCLKLQNRKSSSCSFEFNLILQYKWDWGQASGNTKIARRFEYIFHIAKTLQPLAF